MEVETYERPALTVIGSVAELTLRCKDLTGSDGDVFLGITPLGNCST